MFTLQASAFEGLRGQLPDQVVDILKDTLTNCGQLLEHRGPIGIDFPLPSQLTEDTAGKGGAGLWLSPGTLAKFMGDVVFKGGIDFGDGGTLCVPFEMHDDIAPGEVGKDAWHLGDDLARDEDLDKVQVSDGILGDVRARGSNSTGNGGARGWYTLGANGENQIISIQRQAKMCYCQAKIANGNDLTIVDNVEPMDGGQSPVDAAADELAVEAGFKTHDDAYLIIVWDETNKIWRPSDSSLATIAWGKVQGTVTNQSGATHLTVSVKTCDFDGNNVAGDAFNVKTLLDAKRRTALAQDDVVGYVSDAAGNKTIITDCWNHYMLVVSQERFWLCGLQIDNEGHITGWHDGVDWHVRGTGTAYP